MEIDFPSVGQLLAAVPVLGLVLALLNVWMSSRNERRRSQPVVIVHKRGDLVFAKQVERWVAQCVLKNEGGGPAFNVTFGVEIKGVRFPYRMKPDDLRPSRQRVVASGAQLPEPNPVVPAGMEPGFSIFVSPLDKLGLGSTSEEDEVYWARYENPQGHTWETRNSADRAGTMKIRRVWKHGLRNWKDRRARERLNRRGVEIERTAASELEAAMGAAPSEDHE